MEGIGTNYSQFYKGSEQIKSYGSGNGKKDTIVRYEFNTTDEKGNKIMDKMSREETFKTMNAITAQYGDNVIVEFSGDGLTALEEHKGKLPIPEQPAREIPEDMITYLDGPEPLSDEVLAKMNERHGDDTGALMKAYDPDAYDEMCKVHAEGVASGTQEGLVAGFRYMWNWVNKTAKSDPGWVDKARKIQEEQEASKSAEQKLSQKAKKYLESLRKKYGDFDFIIANDGDDKKGLVGKSSKEYSVIFSSDELEKMADDENYAAERMKKVQKIVDMSERISKEFGFGRAWDKDSNSDNGVVISKMAVTFDEDGNMSLFAELEKMSEKQQERAEEAREKRAEEKEDDKSVKRIQIEAGSEEELFDKIREVNWDKA